MKRSSTFEGFETFSNAFLMSFKMHVSILVALAFVTGFVAFSQIDLRAYETRVAIAWTKINMAAAFPLKLRVDFPYADGDKITAPAKDLIRVDELVALGEEAQAIIKRKFKYSALIFLLYPAILFLFFLKSKKQSDKKHIRGAQLITQKEYVKTAKKKKLKTDLPIGQIRMPFDAETKHLLLVGKSGTGKTNAVNQIIERLRERGERAIIYDSKGDFVSKFYDRYHDVIFNPLDSRSVRWSVFNDIKLKTDIKSVAASQIPEPNSRENPFWNNSARGILAGGFKHLHEHGFTKNADIWRFFRSEDEDIATALTAVGEISAKYLEKPNSDTTKSIISTLVSYIGGFEFLADYDGDFSITEWVKNGKGFLFISSFADIRDTLKPIISLFIDILSMRLLSLPEYPDRKTFFILEELWTLQKLPALLDLITQSRSKGGALILSLQEVAQLDAIYGHNGRKTIFNNTGSQVVFSCSESETAEYCSKFLGEEEVLDAARSYTLGVDKFKDGVNISQSRRNKRIVMPSEIRALDDLESISRFNGFAALRNTFEYKAYEIKNDSFVMNDNLKLERVKPDGAIDDEFEIEEPDHA